MALPDLGMWCWSMGGGRGSNGLAEAGSGGVRILGARRVRLRGRRAGTGPGTHPISNLSLATTAVCIDREPNAGPRQALELRHQSRQNPRDGDARATAGFEVNSLKAPLPRTRNALCPPPHRDTDRQSQLRQPNRSAMGAGRSAEEIYPWDGDGAERSAGAGQHGSSWILGSPLVLKARHFCRSRPAPMSSRNRKAQPVLCPF
jgi:hypothetical protein